MQKGSIYFFIQQHLEAYCIHSSSLLVYSVALISISFLHLLSWKNLISRGMNAKGLLKPISL